MPAAETHPPARTLLVVRTGASVAELKAHAVGRKTFFIKSKRESQSESILEALEQQLSSDYAASRDLVDARMVSDVFCPVADGRETARRMCSFFCGISRF